MIVILNDITKIKELEKTANKIRAKFFSQIAHEFRTPLNSIIPLSNSLKAYMTDERSIQYVNIIYNSARHLENLVEDALDMSRF